jgi:replicative DNA helicase
MMNKTAICEGHEQVLLSAMMNGTDALPLNVDDFSSPPNRTIYNRIRGLTNRSLLAVTDALRRSGELDKVGGAHRITEIALLPHDAENLDYALGEVLTVSRQRQASKIGAHLHRGDITVKQAQEYLAKLNQRREPEKSWMDALSAAVVTPSLQSCSPMKAPPEA